MRALSAFIIKYFTIILSAARRIKEKLGPKERKIISPTRCAYLYKKHKIKKNIPYHSA